MFRETEMSFWHPFVPKKEFSVTISQHASPADPKPWFRPYSLQAVKLHGGIDILVSNAAVNPFFGNLMDVTEEVWDKVRGNKAARGGPPRTAQTRSALTYICQVPRTSTCEQCLGFVPGVHLGKGWWGVASSLPAHLFHCCFSQFCLLPFAPS